MARSIDLRQPELLRTFAKFLMPRADQTGEQGKSSVETIVGRHDAKAKGYFYSGYVAKDAAEK